MAKQFSQALFAAAGGMIVCGVLISSLSAQEAPKPAEAPDAASGPTSTDELALEQSRVADKYAKLEQLMLKMAELEGLTNPKRAQLLTRAVEQSKDRLTKTQLESLVKLLNQQQLKRALDGQTVVQTDLKALLELLMSEDRSDRLKSEQQRLKEYIKEVERLIRLEKSLQGQTEAGADAKRLAQEQGRIAGQTGDLSRKIRENEEGSQPQESSEDQKPNDQQPGEQQPGENQGEENQQNQQGQQQGQQGQKGQQGKSSDQKSDSQKSDSQKSDGQKSDSQKSGDQKGAKAESGDQKSGDQKSGDQKSGDQKGGKQKSGDDKSGKS